MIALVGVRSHRDDHPDDPSEPQTHDLSLQEPPEQVVIIHPTPQMPSSSNPRSSASITHRSENEDRNEREDEGNNTNEQAVARVEEELDTIPKVITV